MTRRSVVLVVAALGTWWLTVAHAQTQNPPGQTDIMPALLAEVRGLRVAMEQMTAAGPRVQLALGRLQLQEQRLSAATARLAAVRNELAGGQRRAVEFQENVANLEAALSGQREMPKPSGEHTAEQIRKMMAAELTSMQSQLGALTVDVQRLTNEETALANDVSAEQARWSDLNQRLEDLERALRPVK